MACVGITCAAFKLTVLRSGTNRSASLQRLPMIARPVPASTALSSTDSKCAMIMCTMLACTKGASTRAACVGTASVSNSRRRLCSALLSFLHRSTLSWPLLLAAVAPLLHGPESEQRKRAYRARECRDPT